MADLQEKIIIHKPIEEVFAFLANPENRPDFFVNIVKVEKLTSTEKEIGSRYKEIRQLSNRKVASELEIVDFDRDKKITFVTNSNGLKVQYSYSFEEVEEGTKVIFEGNVQTNSFRTRIMRPLLVNMVKKEDGDNLLSVKKVLEGSEVLTD